MQDNHGAGSKIGIVAVIGVIAAGALTEGRASAAVPERAWATYVGGEKSDQVYGVAVDATGNIYVSGLSNSFTGIATPGAYRTAPVGSDCFLVKFDPAGVRLWGTYFGGTGDDQCDNVAVGSGGVVVVGGTTSDGIATMGAFQGVKGAQKDGFVAMFTEEGMLAWSTYLGGDGTNDSVLGAAIDAQGEVYVVGRIVGLAAITSMGAHQPDYGGGGERWLPGALRPGGRDGVGHVLRRPQERPR